MVGAGPAGLAGARRAQAGEPLTTRTGADLLVEAFQALGVDCVFGLPGTQVVPVFEALRRNGLHIVVPTHELAAGFMAMGYARASEPPRPGVLVTIPGPGFTYALTPLAEAKLDAVPLVFVTLAPTRGPDGEPGFQAVDQGAVARPLVKDVIEVSHSGEIPAGLARAGALALAHPRGPVLVQLTEETLGQVAGPITPAAPVVRPPSPDWSPVLEALRAARRPALVVTGDFDGSGLGELAARNRVPVCVTPAARGAVPDSHPWVLICDDQRTGLDTLNAFFAGVDFCLVLGGQLSHVATAGYALALPAARMTWVHRGTTVGAGHFPGARTVAGDPGDLLDAWRGGHGAGASEWTDADVERWRARLRADRHMAHPEPKVQGVAGGTPEQLFAAFGRALPAEAIVVTDSGVHQVLTRRYLTVRGRRGLIFPSDFQSMGFGLPAALGARLAAPGRPVVAIVGDGGFLMSGMELLTAAKERIPVVAVVFNDGQLNLIRLQQIREYGREHGVSVPPLDFEAFAQAAGVGYLLAEGDPTLALRDALATGGPALVEVRLGDTAALTRARVSSRARETVRGLLSPSVIRWLKGLFR